MFVADASCFLTDCYFFIFLFVYYLIELLSLVIYMYDSWLNFVWCTTLCSWTVIYSSVLLKIAFFSTTLAVPLWRTWLSSCSVFVVAAVVLSAFNVLFPFKLVARRHNFRLMWLCLQLAHTEGVLAAVFHAPASESWPVLLLLVWWYSNGLHYLR